MTDESVQIVNKPEFLEVSDGEVIIPIATNIPIDFSLPSPVLPKAATMEDLSLNDTTNFQHQTDLLRQELKKTLLRIMILKTSSIKNWRMKERLKMTQLKFYMKELECFKRRTSVLKIKLKSPSGNGNADHK